MKIRLMLLAGMALTVLAASVGPAGGESGAEVPQDVLAAVERARSGVAALADSRSLPGRAGGVASPATFLDPVGSPADASPYHRRGDLSAAQIRNGPNQFELRFFLAAQPDTWNAGGGGETGAVLRLDAVTNGTGPDFDLVVLSTPRTGKVAVVGEADFNDPSEVTCIVRRGVRDLGRTPAGYGYSVRVPFSCLGGKRGFSARMAFLYAWWPGDTAPTGDVLPNRRWTPTVRPA